MKYNQSTDNDNAFAINNYFAIGIKGLFENIGVNKNADAKKGVKRQKIWKK